MEQRQFSGAGNSFVEHFGNTRQQYRLSIIPHIHLTLMAASTYTAKKEQWFMGGTGAVACPHDHLETEFYYEEIL